MSGGTVDATAGSTVSVALTMSHDELQAADAGAAVEEAKHAACPAIENAPVATADDVDAVIAAALARFAADPVSLDDGELMPSKGPVFVDSDGADGLRVTTRALPSPGRFIVRTSQELRNEADRTGKEQMFLSISDVQVVDDCATIAVRVDVMKPSKMDPYGLCCCVSHDVYTKQDGRWVFARRRGASCA